MERTVLHKTPSVERRPALASTVQRSAAASVSSPVRNLQQRIGNRATQDLIARSIAAPAPVLTTVAPTVKSVTPPAVQLSSSTTLPPKVSRPGDPAELEA